MQAASSWLRKSLPGGLLPMRGYYTIAPATDIFGRYLSAPSRLAALFRLQLSMLFLESNNSKELFSTGSLQYAA
jgi:hypothetical protein